MTIPLIIGVGVVLVVILLSLGKRRPGEEGDQPYVRVEGAEIAAFYEPYAPFLAETPPDIAAFTELLAERLDLSRATEEYPTDPAATQAAANAFVAACTAQFGVELSLDSPDVTQLDRVINRRLIAASLRPFFADAGLREDLDEAEIEAYQQAMTELRIPEEPLFYYCMGSFWGEWLCRHRQAVWALYEPLRPIQVFPDMISSGSTVCIHPFSQVVKKMSDPEGDQLAFKAAPGMVKRYFPPFPLLVSLSDAEEAVFALLPPAARRARRLEGTGRVAEALASYEEALAAAPDHAALCALAVQCACRAEDWERAGTWLRTGLALSPEHPVLCHNLAVLLARQPEGMAEAISLLRTAIAALPNYGRARLTLAAFYAETGEAEQALAEAQWVLDNDPELAEAAAELIAGLQPSDEEPSASAL